MGRGSLVIVQDARDPFSALFGGRRGSSRPATPEIPLHDLIEQPGVSTLAFAALEKLIAAGELDEPLLAARSCLGALQSMEDITQPQGPAQHFIHALLRHLASESYNEWMSHKETSTVCKFCGISVKDEALKDPDFCLAPLHARLLIDAERWHDRVLERESLLRSARDSFPRALCTLSVENIYEELHMPTPSRDTLRRVLGGRGGLVSLHNSFKRYQKKARSGAVNQSMSFFDALPKVKREQWLHCLEIAVLGSRSAAPGVRFDRPRFALRENRGSFFSFADTVLTNLLTDRDHPDFFGND